MSDDQRKACVIGASSPGGLGEACALRLAEDGYAVTVAGRRMDLLEALARKVGGRALPVDMSDEEDIARLAAKCDPVDVLVNAAGTTDAARLARISRQSIEAQFELHVTANMLLIKHFTPLVRPGGSIVLFSSLTARVAGEGLAAYSCAKAAVEHLVRIAALELGAAGIRVNAVAPGFSATPMTEGIFANPALAGLYLGEAPYGERGVGPEEVADAVSWLAGPRCFASGETIQVSGGAQLGRL
ncbi:MAG: SDR family oxidoreductase, partial [Sandarakinorhabdus sp.]|nr:SDR family oxidoreductase [Sandarakinorhabdus sp.]